MKWWGGDPRRPRKGKAMGDGNGGVSSRIFSDEPHSIAQARARVLARDRKAAEEAARARHRRLRVEDLEVGQRRAIDNAVKAGLDAFTETLRNQHSVWAWAAGVDADEALAEVQELALRRLFAAVYGRLHDLVKGEPVLLGQEPGEGEGDG